MERKDCWLLPAVNMALNSEKFYFKYTLINDCISIFKAVAFSIMGKSSFKESYFLYIHNSMMPKKQDSQQGLVVSRQSEQANTLKGIGMPPVIDTLYF